MDVQIANKKRIIGIVILVLLVGSLAVWRYYAYHQNQWLARKQQVESRKAEEITIRIIEGWTNQEIAGYLEKQGIAGMKDFLNSVKNYHTLEYDSFLPKETRGDLQGFLYPDTYRLFKSITDRKITSADEAATAVIKKFLEAFRKRLPRDTSQLAKQQGLTLYQAVILASIVENETGRNVTTAETKAKLDVERKIVAGIFYNRLRANMALQSDATINYITGKKDPAPALADLEIKSPYNTYKNRGLPPTPIGNPSLSSIMAVLEPAKTEYFYFLHQQPSGEVVYAKTYEEHVRNKQRYLK